MNAILHIEDLIHDYDRKIAYLDGMLEQQYSDTAKDRLKTKRSVFTAVAMDLRQLLERIKSDPD